MFGRKNLIAKLESEAASQEEARRWFADELVGTGLLGPYIARWAFLAFPPLTYVAMEDNPKFARDLGVFTRSFKTAMHAAMVENRSVGDLADRIDRAMSDVQVLAAKHECYQYRDIAIFYGQSLGFMPLLVRRDGVDWNRVAEAERAAYFGEFRATEWWPE